MKDMLRIGMIGAGNFARKHLAALKAHRERARVMLAARKRLDEPFPEAQALGARLLPADDLIASDEVDAVCVCTPTHEHRPLAEAALWAGKHVFCEKPLALTLGDVDALIGLAKDTGRVLVAGHLTRHSPLYACVGEALRGGRLGPVRALHSSRMQAEMGDSWRMRPGEGGGAAFDLLIHDFDLLNWFLGRPDRVAAEARFHPSGAGEYLAATFTYSGGLQATVTGGFILPPGTPFHARLEVFGERAVLTADTADSEAPVQLRTGDSAECLRLAEAPGLESEWAEILDQMSGEPPTRLLLENARFAVECAKLATRAAESGSPVMFP